jgi:hypothetical protein
MKAQIEKQNVKKSKRTQSSIIITVLLILVAIAGVLIMANWIIPMIKDNLASANLRVEISIDRDGTFYNDGSNTDCGGVYNCVKDPRTYVKVTRAAGDTTQLSAIKFIFRKGDSIFVYTNHNVPAPVETKTYSFALFDANKTDSVELIPIVITSGGKTKSLDAVDKVDIKTDNSKLVSGSTLQPCSLPVATSGSLPPYPDSCPGRD